MTPIAASESSVGRLYWASAALAALTLPAMSVDMFVAHYPPGQFLWDELRGLFGWSEVFAHGVGVAVIAIAIFVLDEGRRRHIPRILATAYLAGLMANLGKMLVARVRPRFADLEGSALDTFLGWLPALNDLGSGFDSGFAIQSFPSGHTATGVGMALGMSRVYPHGRWFFFLIAGFAAAQRMDVLAHYLSDVIASTAIGCFCAALIADPRALGKWFDRIEQG